MRRLFLCFFLPLSLLANRMEESECTKRHILFLLAKKETTKALDEYLSLYEKTNEHNFDLLKEMCHEIFDQGASSSDLGEQLLTLFGISLSGTFPPTRLLESTLRSPFPAVQGAALSLLKNMYDDRAEHLIGIALKSDYLGIRYEALHLLAARKSSQAVGQINSLSNLLRGEFRSLFVELYAMNGSYESIQTLRQMIGDRDTHVRTASILYSALYHRDDLLPSIQATLTHSDPDVRETASYAIGVLGDATSIEALRRVALSPFPETRLAALISLYRLGQTKVAEEIEEMAKEGNLFAIYFLGELREETPILLKLMNSVDPNIRLNANLALLKKRDPQCLPMILEILQADLSSVGFSPTVSQGRSLVAYRFTPISSNLPLEKKNHLQAISLNFQEGLLSQTVELPPSIFLEFAKTLMKSKQTPLVPHLVHLLENEASEEVKELLREKAYGIGHPLLRNYCKLALYRLHTSEYDIQEFHRWLSSQRGREVVRFRPMIDPSTKEEHLSHGSTLSPEEYTGLLIESYDALAKKHDQEGIKLLLEMMRDGHEKNRFAFAGLLLKAIGT